MPKCLRASKAQAKSHLCLCRHSTHWHWAPLFAITRPLIARPYRYLCAEHKHDIHTGMLYVHRVYACMLRAVYNIYMLIVIAPSHWQRSSHTSGTCASFKVNASMISITNVVGFRSLVHVVKIEYKCPLAWRTYCIYQNVQWDYQMMDLWEIDNGAFMHK